MSDELTIQPGVNPQIQPKKTSTTPYALGGAAEVQLLVGALLLCTKEHLVQSLMKSLLKMQMKKM